MKVIVTQKSKEITVVNLDGHFDTLSVPEFRKKIDQLLESGTIYYIVDLSDTTFMDSAGMSVLVSLLKQARHQHGDVRLVWPKREAPRRILNLTRFDRVFTMAESVEAAMKNLITVNNLAMS